MKQSGAPLADNEKLMIINIYNYFLGDNSRKEDHLKLSLRKWVVEILGVTERTVASVVTTLLRHTKLLDDKLKKARIN
jgi:hypothetical protein